MLKSKMLRVFSLILVLSVAGCVRGRNVNLMENSDVHGPSQVAISQVASTNASMSGFSEERPDQQSLWRNASSLVTKRLTLFRTGDPVLEEKNQGLEKVRAERFAKTVSASSVLAADQQPPPLELLMGSASQEDSELSYSAPVAAVNHGNPTAHQHDHNTDVAKSQSKELLAEDTASDTSETMKPARRQQEQAVPTEYVAKNPWRLFRKSQD